MVREAVKVELTNNTGNPRRYTCADGVAITKGAILTLTDPRTAATCAASGDFCAGIASMDKVASDGSTSISAYTDGIFELNASGAITAGNPVETAAGGNYVRVAGPTASGAIILGYALETAADGEVINVRVQL